MVFFCLVTFNENTQDECVVVRDIKNTEVINMSTKPTIVSKFPFAPLSTAVSQTVAQHFDKLKDIGFSDNMLLELYAEVLEFRPSKKELINPMPYIGRCMGQSKELAQIHMRELEVAYKETALEFTKIKPLDFIAQYETYTQGKVNDTAIENGLFFESFYKFAHKEDRILVIDPSPSMMRLCYQKSLEIKYTFTDNLYLKIFQHSALKTKVVDIWEMNEPMFDRVLYCGRNQSEAKLRSTLELIRDVLVPQKQTNIYMLMPTQYIEKRETAGELWNFLNQNYTIYKITLIDYRAVKTTPKKRCIVVLQNEPARKNYDIHVQKTRLIDPNTLATLEFRRIPLEHFANRDRTISEMYDSDYIDYSKSKRRNKSLEYKYTNEISIWVSVSREKEMYRPYYSVYHYPNADQKRKNKHNKGTPFKTRIRGKYYKTKEEAIASAEYLLLLDENLAKGFCKLFENEYTADVISLKTLIFLRWKQLKSDLFAQLFFQPHSAHDPLSSLMIGAAQTEEIIQVIDDTIANLNLSETAAEPLWKQMLFAFDHAVVQGYYSRNPIRKSLEVRREKRLNKADTRSAMVSISFSAEDEKRFLFYLNSDTQNGELSLATSTRYYTGLPLSVFCALTRTDYLRCNFPDMGQLSITKYFPRGSTTSEELPEKKKRFVPLVSAIAHRLDERIQSGIYKYKNQPLFSQSRDKKKPLTPRQMRDYYNKIIKKMDMPEHYLSLADGENEPELTDVNRYGSDFLAANFDFHAYYSAKMEPEEIDFLVGRKPGTTEAQFYCDYNNPFNQLAMRVKLDRWSAVQTDSQPNQRMQYADIDSENVTLQSEGSKYLTELNIELDISECNTMENLTLELFARFGANVSVEYYEEEL